MMAEIINKLLISHRTEHVAPGVVYEILSFESDTHQLTHYRGWEPVAEAAKATGIVDTLRRIDVSMDENTATTQYIRSQPHGRCASMMTCHPYLLSHPHARYELRACDRRERAVIGLV